jgi:hypothetical protein
MIYDMYLHSNFYSLNIIFMHLRKLCSNVIFRPLSFIIYEWETFSEFANLKQRTSESKMRTLQPLNKLTRRVNAVNVEKYSILFTLSTIWKLSSSSTWKDVRVLNFSVLLFQLNYFFSPCHVLFIWRSSTWNIWNILISIMDRIN